ncbi:hypothetical protein BMS3Abin07_02364 [bacterium BMS3Abin07]|nr:hypothetical protein BMS3Abin07_02364 [bacterium BMS3Abin07]GBE31389.1 hypothetical protein BMS3Bbin05_00289 [bacterium BMS3Bbin05]HDL21269.1 TPM domain-containing protein [Nitrospirota bacterium]HDO21348.1 TPM domain-containing protein [Nitrospirota bacterium]
MISRYKTALLLIFFIVIPAVCYSVTPPVPDVPPNYVVDLANIINDSAEMKLDAYLRELEQKTTAQVVVLTILSLDGESLEDFSINLANNRWKLGRKGKDNGALLLISLKDKKYRFEIGYGLEGLLPDSMVGSIGRKYLVPYFRRGDYSSGIYLATLAVINTISKNAGVTIGNIPEAYGSPRSIPAKKLSTANMIWGILFLVVAVYLFIRHPWLFLLLLFGGGGRGGWGGGGGGGGFGGGGGGGFGGGGASGGW